jgi:hypothetical protein
VTGLDRYQLTDDVDALVPNAPFEVDGIVYTPPELDEEHPFPVIVAPMILLKLDHACGTDYCGTWHIRHDAMIYLGADYGTS